MKLLKKQSKVQSPKSKVVWMGTGDFAVGRDGALRRPRRRAQRQATERIARTTTIAQRVPPAERGRGHRSAMSLPFKDFGPAASAAFTMIEIALCLAIIGFALVAIIGVLPTGLSVQKDNREETIINYEANFLMDAIRNGAQGQDDLTNHVLAITNRIYTWVINGNSTNLQNPNPVVNYFTTSNFSVNGTSHPAPFLTNGMNIIGLLSIPKYFHTPNGFISNAITADFRAISDPATDEGSDPASRDFAFRYRVDVELVQYGDNFTGYDTSWTNYTAVPQNTPEYAWRQNNFLLDANLHPNLNLIRLRFRWPVLPNGKTGQGRQVFRTAAGGSITNMGLGGRANVAGYFIQPGNYTQNAESVW